MVCRSCGTIADVDCAVDETPCLTASDDHGFAIDEAEVTYWGTCPACAAAVVARTEPEHHIPPTDTAEPTPRRWTT